MTRATLAEARIYDSWLDYNAALIRAIAPLTIEQLQHRPIPHLRTPGALAQHIVFGRALHLTNALGATATTVLQPYLQWDDVDAPQHPADAIVEGLERTWQVISATVKHGDASDEIAGEVAQSVLQHVWGLLDHDLPHAGELSLFLGAMGVPGVEI